MKKLLTAVLCAALCVGTVAALPLGFAGCGDDNTIVVGYTIYEPMNYMENGELTGHDTELAQLVLGDMLGYNVKFQEITWDYKVAELESHNIDVIWNGMTITDELKESILISESYMVNQQVLIAPTDVLGNYNDASDLVGVKVAVENGSAADNLVSDIEGIVDGDINRAESQAKALMEVGTGASAVGVIDITMAQSMTGEGTSYANIGYKDIGFPEELYGVGMRKDDTELCNKINEALAELEAEGTLDELYQKYLG